MFLSSMKSNFTWLQIRIRSAPLYLRATILTVAVGGLVSLQLFALFGDQTAIDQKLVFPYLFNIREQINPRKINPRIKIFALDDQTYGYLKGDDISLPEWANLFRAISKTPNVTIFIDKLFSKFYSESDVREFEAIMDEAKPRLNIIAFSYQDQIRFREPISSELVSKKMSSFVEINPELRSRLDASSYQIYGTTPRILEKVTRFGHAEYPGTGRVLALRNVQANLMVPFAGFTVAQKIQVNDGQILVDNHDIHADANGEIVVNFAPQKETNKNAYALMSAIARVRKNLDLSIINPGDIVVILPAMYTGNTDFKATPFGNMPGGLILASVMDSVLGGKWINYIEDPGFFILIPGVLMFIFGCFMPPRVATIRMILISTAIFATSTLLFVFFNVMISFVFPMTAILLGGVSAVTISAAANEAEERRIKREVEIATLVQRSFLRNGTFHLGNSFLVTGISKAASECGGDWWGSFHRFGYNYVMIGDAVGHGVPAALVTAVGFSVIRLIQEELGISMPPSIDPAAILRRINAILCEMGTESAFMTFQVIRINDATGECLYSNAGNSHPILIPAKPDDDRLSPDNRYKTLVIPGEPVGASLETEYHNHKVTLRPGDHLLMYTDGLIENNAEKDRAINGRAWLKKTLNEIGDAKLESQHDKIWDAYIARIGKRPPIDDSTLVTVYRSPSESTPVELLFEEQP